MDPQELKINDQDRARVQGPPNYTQSLNNPSYSQQLRLPIIQSHQPCLSAYNQPQVMPVYNQQPNVSFVMYRQSNYLIWSIINTLCGALFFYRYAYFILNFIICKLL